MSSYSDSTPNAFQSKHLDYQVIAVTNAAEQSMFLDVPTTVYAHDRYWVSPLLSDISKKFEASNPFFQYGRLQQFIAIREAKPIGRIVAAVNDRLVDREGINIGIFGFFECVEDFEVAQSLLDAAAQWLREQGMTQVRGPIDLSTHNNCLFLVDGFDSSPMVMMPYNPAYYPKFLEQDGWHKAKDAYAYDFPLDQPLSPEFERGYKIACKSGVKFRPLKTKGEGFEQDAIALYNLFTKAFSDNWSFYPAYSSRVFRRGKITAKFGRS